MTKDEFRQTFKAAITDIKDPKSDFYAAIDEVMELVPELKQHDPVLAAKFQNVADALRDVGGYIQSKGEFVI